MHADCMLLHVCSALASIPSLLAVCVWLETLGRMLPDPAKANLLTAVDADVLAVTRCTGGVRPALLLRSLGTGQGKVDRQALEPPHSPQRWLI